jgi:hypothetical protein
MAGAGFAKFFGLPGIIVALGSAAYAASTQFRELADQMGGNLKIAVSGIYHACQGAIAGLGDLYAKLMDFGANVARAVEQPFANALRALGYSVGAYTPWHDRQHFFSRPALTPLTPQQALPVAPLPCDWKRNFPMPPGMAAPGSPFVPGAGSILPQVPASPQIPPAGGLLRQQSWEHGGGLGTDTIVLDGPGHRERGSYA